MTKYVIAAFLGYGMLFMSHTALADDPHFKTFTNDDIAPVDISTKGSEKVRLLSADEQAEFIKLRRKQLYGEKPKTEPIKTRVKAFYETLSLEEKRDLHTLLSNDKAVIKKAKTSPPIDTKRQQQKNEWESLSDKEKARRKAKMLQLFKQLPETEKAKINDVRKRARENKTSE